MNGVLLIDKPKGITSRDAVNTVIKIFNTKKVGHTGTLDPIATGVLVICVGKATKLVEYLTSTDKEYIATVELGTLTDTLDNTGNVLKEEDSKIQNYIKFFPVFNSIDQKIFKSNQFFYYNRIYDDKNNYYNKINNNKNKMKEETAKEKDESEEDTINRHIKKKFVNKKRNRSKNKENKNNCEI